MSIEKLDRGTTESHWETRRQRLHLQLRSGQNFTVADELELMVFHINWQTMVISVSCKKIQKIDGVCADRSATHNTHLCSTVCSQARNAHTSRLAQESHCHLGAPEKNLVIWCFPCLILGCLTCFSPRALQLLHSLFLQWHKNTQHHRYNQNNSENTQYITHIPSVDKLRHQESLWHEDLQSGGSPRTTTPTNYRDMFESRISAEAKETTHQSFRETWCRSSIFLVLWHGRSREVMFGKRMRTCEWNDPTIIQSRNSMHGWPLILRRKWVRRRRVHSVLKKCSEMYVFGSYWETHIFLVCQQACAYCDKMDKILWRTLGAFDLVHSSHMWVLATLLCGKHSYADQDCFKTLIFQETTQKNNIRRHSVLCGSLTFVPRSWMCKEQTSVPQKLKSFLSMQVHAWTVFPFSLSRIWWLKYFIRYRTEQMDPREEPNMHNYIPIKHTNVIPTNVDHTPSNATHSGSSTVLYVHEDNEAAIKMIIEGRSPTMRHDSRAHRVAMDCLTGLIWSQTIKTVTLTPNTNPQTCWLDGISHVMSGTIFFISLISAISVPLAAHWRRGYKIKKKKKGLCPSLELQWWILLLLLRQVLSRHRVRLHRKVGGCR